jgi:hypothetical protein
VSQGWSRGVVLSLLGVLCLVLRPPAVAAQGTPLPLPAEPGGARPPVYTQPPAPPQPLTTPAPATPAAPGPGGPAPAAPHPVPAEPPAGEGGITEDARDEMREAGPRTEPPRPEDRTAARRLPQTTAFDELTRGVGDSGALLRD